MCYPWVQTCEHVRRHLSSCYNIQLYQLEYLNSTPPPWSGGGAAKNLGKWSGVEGEI